MSEAPVFTEEEFVLLQESLNTQKEKDTKYIEYSEKGTGHPLMDSLMRVLEGAGHVGSKISFREKLVRQVEDITILQGKLQQMKRFQRQQNAQPTNTASA